MEKIIKNKKFCFSCFRKINLNFFWKKINTKNKIKKNKNNLFVLEILIENFLLFFDLSISIKLFYKLIKKFKKKGQNSIKYKKVFRRIFIELNRLKTKIENLN